MFDDLLKFAAAMFCLAGASFLFYFVVNLIRDDIRYRKTK
jgi:hypothetical protein